jgi:hypothetical protein
VMNVNDGRGRSHQDGTLVQLCPLVPTFVWWLFCPWCFAFRGLHL